MASNTPTSVTVSTPKKRKILSIKEKHEILQDHDKGLSRNQLQAKYSIKRSTVHDLIKNKQKILSYCKKLESSDKGMCLYRERRLPLEDLDTAVFQWYTQQRTEGVPVRGIDIQDAAHRLAGQLGFTNFKCSSGWLWRFRRRHGIVNKDIIGLAEVNLPTTTLVSQKDKVKTTRSCSSGIEVQEFNKDEIHSADQSMDEGQQPLQEGVMIVNTEDERAWQGGRKQFEGDQQKASEGNNKSLGNEFVTPDDSLLQVKEEPQDVNIDEVVLSGNNDTAIFFPIQNYRSYSNKGKQTPTPNINSEVSSSHPESSDRTTKQDKDVAFCDWVKLTFLQLSDKQKRQARLKIVQILTECEEDST